MERNTGQNVRISIVIAKQELELIRKAVKEGRVVSVSEAIRTGLRDFIKQNRMGKNESKDM